MRVQHLIRVYTVFNHPAILDTTVGSILDLFKFKIKYGKELSCLNTKDIYGKVTNTEIAGLGGSVGCAVRLETRRLRVQPPPRSATFFRED